MRTRHVPTPFGSPVTCRRPAGTSSALPATARAMAGPNAEKRTVATRVSEKPRGVERGGRVVAKRPKRCTAPWPRPWGRACAVDDRVDRLPPRLRLLGLRTGGHSRGGARAGTIGRQDGACGRLCRLLCHPWEQVFAPAFWRHGRPAVASGRNGITYSDAAPTPLPKPSPARIRPGLRGGAHFRTNRTRGSALGRCLDFWNLSSAMAPPLVLTLTYISCLWADKQSIVSS